MTAPRHRGDGAGARLAGRARRAAAQLLVGAAATTAPRTAVEPVRQPADTQDGLGDAWAALPPPALPHARRLTA